MREPRPATAFPSPTRLVVAVILALSAWAWLAAPGHAQSLAKTRVGASAVLVTARAGDFTPLAAVSQLCKTHAHDENAPGSLLAAEEGGAVFEGGRFADLATGGGIERHHMLADSISTFSRADGPSIQMEMADHAMTGSWGNSAAARAYRAQQGAMLAEGDSAGAVQMDIMNVRGMFGTKYDDAIVQMLQRIWGGSG